MLPAYVDAVLDVVDLIPPAKVLSYGDVAVLLDRGGPRQVGSVMSRHGSAVPWWRVIRASGQPPEGHDAQALEHYRDEETPLRGRTGGETPSWRVDMPAARWNPSEAEFIHLDAVAAKLMDQTGATGQGVPDPTLSDPRDGIYP